MKSTALASIVTLMDVTGVAHEIIADTFRAFEVFGCAGSIYLALNAAIAWGVHGLERKLAIPADGRRAGPAPNRRLTVRPV